MAKIARSTYELKKLADFWLDLSKLIIASMVFRFFDPRVLAALSWLDVGILVGGLIFSFLCAIVGLRFARKVEGV